MSQPFRNFRGKEIYVDATVFHAVLRASDENAKAFLRQIEQGVFEACASILTMNELAHYLLLSMVADKYGPVSATALQQDHTNWIVEFYPQIEAQLTALWEMDNLLFVSLTHNHIFKMHQNIVNYRLLPRTAMHLAAMQSIGYTAILSVDNTFDGIPYIDCYTLP